MLRIGASDHEIFPKMLLGVTLTTERKALWSLTKHREIILFLIAERQQQASSRCHFHFCCFKYNTESLVLVVWNAREQRPGNDLNMSTCTN